MVDTIYIEHQLESHPRTQAILRRYPKAERILIERYGQLFNSHRQNFRAQKAKPSLILAAKHNKRVLPTPAQYETGGGAHYYFSHMLNCIYDCRYCFLQGMLRSANYLLFVNYEDFVADILEATQQHKLDDKPCWFFSGYDCDSLAYEPVSGFADFFLDACANLDNAVLELRTKSTQIRSLLAREARENVVVAYSLAPERIVKQIEHGTPSLAKRLDSLHRLQEHGWRIGLRFDPIIWYQDYRQDYSEMIKTVFSVLDANKVDSLTLGGFRLPKPFHKSMRQQYPEHWMMYAGLQTQNRQVSYRQEIEREVLAAVEAECKRYIDTDKIFVYHSFESDNFDHQDGDAKACQNS